MLRVASTDETLYKAALTCTQTTQGPVYLIGPFTSNERCGIQGQE